MIIYFYEEILVIWTKKPKLLNRQPRSTPGIGGCLGTESRGTVETAKCSIFFILHNLVYICDI